MQNYSLHSQPSRTHRRRRQRGMALAAGMLVMLGILSLILVGVLAGAHGGTGLLNMTENGDQSASQQGQSSAAYNAADSGVEYTLQWLHSLSGPPSLAKAFPLPAWGGNPGDPAVPYTLGGATFTAWVFPDAANSQQTVKRYLIQSTGQSGGVSQTVQAYVSLTSFGKYAVFLDQTPPNAFWASGSNVFDGPVHSNNSNGGNPPTPTGALNSIVWSDGTAGTPVSPVFTYQGSDAFTVSGPSVNWYRNSYGNTSTPTSEAQWRMIATGGSGSIQTGVSTVPMPATGTLAQQYAAMGQPAPATGTAAPSGIPAGTDPVGVLVPNSGNVATGGIYIHGPVQQMNLSVDPNNSTTQIIQIQQTDANNNPYTTTITLLASNIPPKTLVHVDYMQPIGNSGYFYAMTKNNTYTGITNGVVYADSNIGKTDPTTQQGSDPTTQTLVTNPASGGITGVVADGSALTLATDSSHNVNINGSITYHTPRQKDGSGNPLPESDPSNSGFLTHAGTLGIVSDNVQVVDKDASGNALTNLEVDAAVMAFGTYNAADYATRPAGSMINMGTYIVETRGLFSTANGLNVVSGVACSRFYDNRLADHPPPFFPTTSSQYQVLSWQRVAVPL